MMNKFCQDIADFHEKFKLEYTGAPRFLDVEEFAFRIKVHFEESTEYSDAVQEGDMEKQLDSLVDLVYFAIGTAYRQGLPFEKAWERVHAANMTKRLANDESESLRGFKRDVVKPDDFVPPSFADLLKNRPSYHPRLFMVEGPDACGKTTFAKELARSLGGIYWHMTATKNLTGKAQFDYQLNAIENIKVSLDRGQSVVLDRHWPSEYCYGRVLRDITWADIVPIKTAMQDLNPYFIYCMDKSVDSAVARHKAEIDEAHPYDDEQYRNVYNSYQEFLLSEGEKSGTGGPNTTVRLFDEKPSWKETMHRDIANIRRVTKA